MLEDGSKNFYRDLVTLSSFDAATNSANHQPLPEDWSIVVADVRGSTRAIEEGRYKDVNTIGGSTIVAVLNADRSVSIPFVFGGDGATLAIPPHLNRLVASALLGAKQMAAEAFGLELRVGIIPVRDLLAEGYRCQIAKWQMSATVVQAALSGRGWEHAERLVKNHSLGGKYEIKESEDLRPDADFSGFECRWKEVPSNNGHQLALLVQCVLADATKHNAAYIQVIHQIKKIYGELGDFHPLRAEAMQLGASYQNEVAVRTHGQSLLVRCLYLLRFFALGLFGRALFRFSIDTKTVRWSRYRQELVENTDFRKFDGALKMILDGSEDQRQQLAGYLESQRKLGVLCYGMHESAAALVTCAVFSYDGNHVHFVDGANGGYALAARALKVQMGQRGFSEN